MRHAKHIPAFILGFLLLLAGFAKIESPSSMVQHLQAILLLPERTASGLTIATALVEIVLAAWLLVHITPMLARLVTAGFLVMLLVAMFVLPSSSAGVSPADCGCFGGTDRFAALEEYKAWILLGGLVALLWSLDLRPRFPTLASQHQGNSDDASRVLSHQ